ncbi:hypothetical protein HCD_01740 [Helicobacter cetorum MIT 99-5656]|uniref:Uncharacterized protein n=2 Tax=Helicobacter cetorum TaxID=138563 RepID=I0ER11_HELCM|nr:hypothetical protein HCD_01740 [Helicobacter cetorum MIT 99-5656]
MLSNKKIEDYSNKIIETLVSPEKALKNFKKAIDLLDRVAASLNGGREICETPLAKARSFLTKAPY